MVWWAVRLHSRFNPVVYRYLSSIRIKKSDSSGAARELESYLTLFPDAPDRDCVEQILKKPGHPVK